MSGKCTESSCDSSTETSSSESSSSISSASDCCVTTGGCDDRRKQCKKEIEARAVRTFALDTCVIEYKQRLIKVPSKNFPNIDCALTAVSSHKGGFVIRLEKGTHNVTRGICEGVDYLSIIGDCSPFAGVGYIHACGLKVNTDPTVCTTPCTPCATFSGLDPRLGEGPFQLTLTGRRLIIQGQVNPDFSTVRPRTTVSVVHKDGSITMGEVSCGNGNTLFFTSDLGFTEHIYIGEGFYFNPDVVLTGGSNLLPTHSLYMQGVAFVGGGLWTLGTYGLYFKLRNSILTPGCTMIIVGDYYFPTPNAFSDVVLLAAASKGTTFYQLVAGKNGRIVCDSIAPSAWRAAVFTSSAHACRVMNGSTLSVMNSDFINNCIALSLIARSESTVHNCQFCGNRYGVLALYNSVVSSEDVKVFKLFEQPPAFRNNYVAVTANGSCIVIIPNCTVSKNTYDAILDSRLFKSVNSMPVGHYGHQYSLILFTNNPFLMAEANTHCTKGEIPATSAGRYLNVPALNGLADYSCVKASVKTYNAGQVDPTAQAYANLDEGGQVSGLSNNIAGYDINNPPTNGPCESLGDPFNSTVPTTTGFGF